MPAAGKILLVDTDSKIPNLALTRLSTFHKDRNDDVSLIKMGYSGYPGRSKPKAVDASDFDRVYVSTIFTHNRHMVDVEGCQDVVFGGTGIDLDLTLPGDIETLPMDFSVYPESDETAYGFITRGCIRRCSFCFVPRKEGKLRKENSVNDIIKPHTKQVKFLDNNFLAYKGHMEVLADLVKRGIRCTFSQGLDIRLLNENNARLLDQLNYWEEYIFAFDNINLQGTIEKKLKMLKKIQFSGRLKFFVFVSPKYTNLADDVFRVKWCIENSSLPYIMRENTCWSNERKEFYIDLAAWCNQPKFFKRMDFAEFLRRRHPKNPARQEKSASIYFSNHAEMTAFWGDMPRPGAMKTKIKQTQLNIFA